MNETNLRKKVTVFDREYWPKGKALYRRLPHFVEKERVLS
jgi:hypothetical protein